MYVIEVLNLKLGYKILVFVCLVVLLSPSCKRLKNSKVGKAYHNLTAHYNALFNGREKLKEVQTTLYTGTENNYALILPIYAEGTESVSKSAFGDLDYVNKKATKVIKKHDVSHWVDDAYFMVGQSYFYKRDYFAAIEAFQYTREKYPEGIPGFRSMIWVARAYLELKKPAESFAQFGIIKQTKNFPKELQSELDVALADYYIKNYDLKMAAEKLEAGVKGIPLKRNRLRAYFILGQLYSRLEKYDKSAFYYHLVIKKNAEFELSFQAKMGLADSYKRQTQKEKDRIKRFLVRLTKDKDYSKYWDQVYYQLSKVNFIEGHPKEGILALKRSSVNSKRNNVQKVITLVRLAEEHHKMHFYQDSKAYYDSALKLIDPKDFFDADIRKSQYKTQSELNGNLRVIQAEDSLQQIAKLSQSDIDIRINRILAKKAKLAALDKEVQTKIEKEEKKKARDLELFAEQQSNATSGGNGTGIGNPFGGGSPTPGGGTNGSTDPNASNSSANAPTAFDLANAGANWYFYNEFSIKQGKTSFATKWGGRPNQDDWRKKRTGFATTPADKGNKTQNPNNQNQDPNNPNNPNNPDPLTQNGKGKDSAQKDPGAGLKGADSLIAVKKVYLDSIPFKPFFSNQRLQKGLFGAGSIYYQPLKDYDKASGFLEDLLNRYPDFSQLAETHYLLYNIYTDAGNIPKALEHKNYILKKFPSSNYAAMIVNPLKAKQMAESRKDTALQNLYTRTYEAFRTDNCKMVSDGYIQAMQIPNNVLMAKFEYLNLICQSRKDTGRFLADSLTSLAAKYPGTEISLEASKLSELLRKKAAEAKANNTSTTESTNKKVGNDDEEGNPKNIEYIKDFTGINFNILAFKDSKADLEKIKAKISDYNQNNASKLGLEIISTGLDNGYQLVIVRNFASLESAVNYYVETQKNKPFFEALKLENMYQFIITNDNLRLMRDGQDVGGYYKFFKSNY